MLAWQVLPAGDGSSPGAASARFTSAPPGAPVEAAAPLRIDVTVDLPEPSGSAARVASSVRGTAAPLGGVRALVTYAPRPAYPYEARRQRIIGSGIALLTVASADGNVVDVRMAQSCGSVILDNATLDAFRRWHFKPGTVERVQVPITYTLTGVSY